MKKVYFIASFLFLAMVGFSQAKSYKDLSEYADNNITTNGSRAITGAILNSMLNDIISSMGAREFDTTRMYYADQSFIMYDGDIWSCTVNHPAGQWDSTHFKRLTYTNKDTTYFNNTVIIGGDSSVTITDTSFSYTGGVDNFDIDAGGGFLNIIGAVTTNEHYEIDGDTSIYINSGNTSLYVGTDNGYAGANNLMVGTEAGSSLLAGGGNNTGLGQQSLYSNTTGDNNVAVGTQSLYSGVLLSFNTGVGSLTGRLLTTGTGNFFGGYNAGGSIASGTDNIFIGNTAGRGAASGVLNYNVGIGRNVMISGNGAEFNVCVGYNSLKYNVTGDENVCIGKVAGDSIVGSGNVIIGANTGGVWAGSSRLMIDNSNTSNPLIDGYFGGDSLFVNGNFAINIIDTVASSATIQADTVNLVISGTADIDSISVDSKVPNLSVLYVEFTGTASSSGLIDGKNLKIAGDFAYSPDDILVLQRRGIYFFEISRSAN